MSAFVVYPTMTLNAGQYWQFATGAIRDSRQAACTDPAFLQNSARRLGSFSLMVAFVQTGV
ncbi:MAG: hypothetical protein ACJAU6_003139 [Alphaproteobacteria bacterium]|jgi:hypothetical protein